MQYITTPHEAELNAAEVMKSWGFTDAVATTGGADGGIDVSSKRALAQVKWKGGAAGRPEMQQLYGARGKDASKELFFFAASAYTEQAIKYADEVGIAQFLYDPVGAVEAVNTHARKFAAKPRPVAGKAKASTTDWSVIAMLVFGVALVVAFWVMFSLNW